MPVTITAEERDALFRQAILAFGAFSDLERAIDAGEYEQAYKSGRRVRDALVLLLDGGLGFARRTAEPVTIELPDELLRPILRRLHADSATEYESRRGDFAEAQREEAEVASVRDVCASLLNQL